jgi:hypothetical protein
MIGAQTALKNGRIQEVKASPSGEAEVVDKVAYATLSNFSLASLRNGCAIVRPFARAR